MRQGAGARRGTVMTDLVTTQRADRVPWSMLLLALLTVALLLATFLFFFLTLFWTDVERTAEVRHTPRVVAYLNTAPSK